MPRLIVAAPLLASDPKRVIAHDGGWDSVVA
jgi:hypothetical protein